MYQLMLFIMLYFMTGFKQVHSQLYIFLTFVQGSTPFCLNLFIRISIKKSFYILDFSGVLQSSLVDIIKTETVLPVQVY